MRMDQVGPGQPGEVALASQRGVQREDFRERAPDFRNSAGTALTLKVPEGGAPAVRRARGGSDAGWMWDRASGLPFRPEVQRREGNAEGLGARVRLADPSLGETDGDGSPLVREEYL
ncbi:uncharacterized protein CMC5_005400 [Chondromyces crocatus]|uniref:Uncharacterized protein n=1 Tax=Chondromyces crocatus TaxID=52 RepID=A0A0K1E6U8_CHOCO|nr:uncharacterized protein CMC5_005400 [Chondromyces crocatus]